MRSPILSLLIGLTCMSGMAQSPSMILAPPGWERVSWRSVLVVTWPDLDTRRQEAPAQPRSRRETKGMLGASIDVIGRYEAPLDRYLLEVLPRLNIQLQRAFRMGQANNENSQILSQFMSVAPGAAFFVQPASVWYNGTMPESMRWEGMWGVTAPSLGRMGPMGASKTQTLMNRGNNR